MSKPRKERLGRGLGALLGEGSLVESGEGGERPRTIPVTSIAPNPFQPRREFAEEELAELASSIEENGLLQPLVVRSVPDGGEGYHLVAGERRLRAIRRLGWDDVSVVVRDVEDRTLLVLALVENLQREELSPLEEARGYQALMEDFGLNQDEVARSVGKSRSAVANLIRLLRLPPSVRRLLEEGTLSPGHARALLSLEDPGRMTHLAQMAVSRGWSVREMEERVRRSGQGNGGEGREQNSKGEETQGSADGEAVREALQRELEGALGTRVRLRARQDGRGTIEIPFRDSEDFERLFAALTGRDPMEVTG